MVIMGYTMVASKFGIVLGVQNVEEYLRSFAPERYNKNSYSLWLKSTGGCLFLCREILNRNLFIRYAINKLRPVQSQKRVRVG